MNLPVITVLITTHNYSQFLGDAVESVLSQEFPPGQLEILVVDDGSTDDTSERIKKYGSRLNYLYKPNGGQASALNYGIDRAHGEFIALLDADDLFLPGKLAAVVNAFESDPELGMVYHRLQEWHVETGERRQWEFAEISGEISKKPDQILTFLPQPTSAISFRRSLLAPLLPIPEHIRMLADCYLVTLMPFVAPIRAIPDDLTVYRIHGKNSYTNVQVQESREDSIRKFEMWQVLIGAMTKWLSDHGYHRKNASVLVLLNRWQSLLEELRAGHAGRLRYFLSLLRQNHAHAPIQTWRLTLFNYLCAPLGLLLGRGRAKLFYQWRGAAMARIQRAVAPILGAIRNSKL